MIRNLRDGHFDIYSGGDYPSNMLSNFYPHKFTYEGIECGSMEGLLQSLKFEDIDKQIAVASMEGRNAHTAGKNAPNWKPSQTLWWKGKPIWRMGLKYFERILDMYEELAKVQLFAKALKDTGNQPLSHVIGHDSPTETILTEREFCTILEEIREKLK